MNSKILLIDESEIVNELRSEILESLGYDIKSSLSLAAGFKLIKEFNPKLIITEAFFNHDRSVQIKEFVIRVNKEFPQVKIIITSAYATLNYLDELSGNIHALITKGTPQEEFFEALDSAFDDNVSGGSGLKVKPIWGTEYFPIDRKLCFVLMPFGESWSNRLWKKQIQPIVTECGYHPVRADELYGKDIVEDIWKSINQASVIIADITNRNPNVFYELGMAHTIGKRVILLSQEIEGIPFDINRFRIICYEDNIDGLETLQAELPKYLGA